MAAKFNLSSMHTPNFAQGHDILSTLSDDISLILWNPKANLKHCKMSFLVLSARLICWVYDA